LGKKYEASAFEKASVHWLRHTCGSHMGSSGVPVNLIQKLLGHASVATTSIYTESDSERLWQEVTDLEENRAR
jgi:site-specific recombinase XerD